jgi:hypothetical protein
LFDPSVRRGGIEVEELMYERDAFPSRCIGPVQMAYSPSNHDAEDTSAVHMVT